MCPWLKSTSLPCDAYYCSYGYCCYCCGYFGYCCGVWLTLFLLTCCDSGRIIWTPLSHLALWLKVNGLSCRGMWSSWGRALVVQEVGSASITERCSVRDQRSTLLLGFTLLPGPRSPEGSSPCWPSSSGVSVRFPPSACSLSLWNIKKLICSRWTKELLSQSELHTGSDYRGL